MTPIRPNLRPPSHKQQVGGLGEDIASAHFRWLGYYVFRQGYYNCPCDMVILNPKTGKFHGVEVKARSTYDRYLRSTLDGNKFDFLAIVDLNTKQVDVQYDPDELTHPQEYYNNYRHVNQKTVSHQEEYDYWEQPKSYPKPPESPKPLEKSIWKPTGEFNDWGDEIYADQHGNRT